MVDKNELRFCLDVLTDGADAARPTKLPKHRYANSEFFAEAASITEASRPWIEGDGIQGLGLGEKISGGEPTGEMSVRVYVDQKRPIAQIDHLVPSTVNVGDIEALTDVIEIGELHAEVFSDRVRPVRPGISIARPGGDPGTLGGFVTGRSDGTLYLLSNSHVLADYGRGAVGDPIVQPGDSEAAATGDDVIGELAGFVPFEFSDSGFLNVVDAAIATVQLPHRNVLRVLEIAPREINVRPRVGMQVQKVGRTSDHSVGVITDTDFRAMMRFPKKGSRTKQKLGFRNQVLCSRYTSPGDSGSLVLSSSGRVLGLHFAGSVSASVFNRISYVLDALDVDLVAG